MKFVNETEKKIKVEKENTDPKGWVTLKNGEGIECESENYAKYYREAGLTETESKPETPKAKKEEKKEVKEKPKK